MPAIALAAAIILFGDRLESANQLITVASIIAVTGPLSGIGLYIYRRMKVSRDSNREYKKNCSKFCNECIDFGITSRESAEDIVNSKRIEQVAAKYGLSAEKPDSLIAMIEAYVAQQKQYADRYKQKKLAEQKAREDVCFARLTLYAGLHGVDKPKAIMTDAAKYDRAVANGTSYLPTRKVSDGALFAGIAAGIGGPVPALMSLSDTAKKNSEIEKYNDAVNTLNQLSARVTATALESADEWEKQASAVSSKLVADLPRDEVFSYLNFVNTSAVTTETGAVFVRTWVKADEFKIFDRLDAYVDGSVVAEIYDGDTKLGEALLVFPVYGSDSDIVTANESGDLSDEDFLNLMTLRGIKLEEYNFANCVIDKKPDEGVPIVGICPACGESGKKYDVRLKPGDLWAAER